MRKNKYIPGTVPTLDNWPEGLKLPPKRRAESAPAPAPSKAKKVKEPESILDFFTASGS